MMPGMRSPAKLLNLTLLRKRPAAADAAEAVALEAGAAEAVDETRGWCCW
jgi:hypothetical protein